MLHLRVKTTIILRLQDGKNNSLKYLVNPNINWSLINNTT